MRDRSRRRFLRILTALMLSSLALLLLLDRNLNASISAHKAANHRLRTQIGLLGARGAEAERLRQEQEDAALHMQVVNSLQRSRPLPAEVLSELALLLPGTAHYRQLTRNGDNVRIEGLASSHAAIAELMRNLAASPRIREARLAGVAEAAPAAGAPAALYAFNLELLLNEARN